MCDCAWSTFFTWGVVIILILFIVWRLGVLDLKVERLKTARLSTAERFSLAGAERAARNALGHAHARFTHKPAAG